jgi:glycosyltransferase involved in cell wall biosynthesis
MKFSVCIPNYNYERYLPRTVASVRGQRADLEILVSDNASTDGSVVALRALEDERIKIRVNEANVGFASNLDRAARMASGDVVIMLSSDDLMRPGALEAYERLLANIEPDAIVTSASDVIDSDDRVTGRIGPDSELWRRSDVVRDLPSLGGATVYRVAGTELLRRSLESFKNPLNFLATGVPRKLYEKVEGYGGGRLINPDKWYHWRVLGVASFAYYVDAPLFAYRWHGANQTAQQSASGALKYLVDEYVNTFELDSTLLAKAGLTRDALVRAFVERDIARHGLATLAKGDRLKARRVLLFGAATYPKQLASNWKAWALASLLATGPLGERLSRVAYGRFGDRLQARSQ